MEGDVPAHRKRSLGPVAAGAMAVAGGILCYVIVSFIGLTLRFLLGLALIGFVSPFYEEPLKAIGVIAIALFFAGTFKSRKDGAILGAIAGITFGILEIFDFWVLYGMMVNAGMLSQSMANGLLFARAFTSFPMHILSSLLAGLGIAYAAMSAAAKPRFRDIFSGNALTFWMIAIGFHLVYNVFNIVPMLLTRSDIVGVAFGFIVVLAGVYFVYRVYEEVPDRLEQMPATKPGELVMRAIGRRKAPGAATMPEKKP